MPVKTKKTKVRAKINIGGVAVRAGLSLNKILYTPEELAKFAPTLNDKPILKDHHNITDNTIGLITSSSFNPTHVSVNYSGWIKEDGSGIIERIDDRRIKEVSIGGVVGRLVKENLEDDFFIAKDMRGMELSTTPTPATVGTSIKQTLSSLKEAVTPAQMKNVKPILESTAMINENFSLVNIKENKQKIIEKFVCPLCEEDLSSIEALRVHMREHNIEPDADEASAKNNNKEAKNTMEGKTDKKVDEKVEAQIKENTNKEAELKTREEALATKEKELQEQQDIITKEKRTKLEEDYAVLVKEKEVKAQDISKASDEVVSALIEQVKAIETKEADDGEKEPTKEEPAKEEPAKEEKAEVKDETKGKVNIESTDEVISDYKVEKSEFGSGYALYQESYDPKKYSRLSREEV